MGGADEKERELEILEIPEIRNTYNSTVVRKKIGRLSDTAYLYVCGFAGRQSDL